MDWIKQYSDLISALSGVGTLVVWIIYLQLFARSYHRQLRATLLITRGAGEEDGDHCFISNMSSGPVYVQSVMVTLETNDGTIVTPATAIENQAHKTRVDSLGRSRQGPLHPGQVKDAGSFESLMSHGLQGSMFFPGGVRAVSVEVMAVYGSEDLPVGACRRFILVKSDDGFFIQGDTTGTKQIRKRHERRRLLNQLKHDK